MVIFCFSFKNSSNEKKPETVESGLLRWTKNNNNLLKIQRYNFRFNHCECVHCTHCACTRVHYSMFTAFLLLYLHSLSAFYALWSRLLLHPSLCSAEVESFRAIYFTVYSLDSWQTTEFLSICVTWPQYLLRKHFNENKCFRNCAFGFGCSQPYHDNISKTLERCYSWKKNTTFGHQLSAIICNIN